MPVCPNCHETNPEAGAACPRCDGFHYVPEASIDDSRQDPIIGRMAAGKYVILGLISEGGMGAVYRALQLPVEREVAFKVLRTELKDSDNGRDRFIREARAVSRLNHPNIITLYDFGFEDGRHPYMVMEYAPGKSLAKWLKTEPVTTDRVLRVTAQILSALTEAHSHGIVHRDLKPENMIITPRGNDPDRVKLLDFGIARMINEGATRGITREGEVFGTPHYMAPEQAQGRKDIGPPADVYAVGIMMWEMLCGRCPFDAPTPLAVLFMHINDPIPPLTARQGVDIIPGLDSVVQKAAAKDPMNRYQTAGEMMTDIGHLFASVTGAHPGVMFGDASQEFVMGDTVLPGTIPPALDSGVRSATPIPGRMPHFTPMTGNIGSGVNAYDPDPSNSFPHPTGPWEEPPAKSNAPLIAIAIVLLLLVGGVAALALGSGVADETAQTEPEVAAPSTPDDKPAPAEIANRDDLIKELVVKPIDEPAEVAEPEDVEVKDEPAPVVKEKPKPKPTPATTPKPKAEPKPEPVAKPQPKSEPKPEPKPVKFDRPPVKFAPPVKQ